MLGITIVGYGAAIALWSIPMGVICSGIPPRNGDEWFTAAGCALFAVIAAELTYLVTGL